MSGAVITEKWEKNFRTKKISKKNKIEAIDYAKENNHNHLINKLDV